MVHAIFADYTASISDLKKQPMAVVNAAHGEVLAILNHNEPVFYCVPKALYQEMVELMDDVHLAELVKKRATEPSFEVDVNDL